VAGLNEQGDAPAPARVRFTRRRLLIGAGAAGLLAVIGYELSGHRSEVPLGPFSTVVSGFPVRTVEDDQPAIPLDRWTISVGGLVERPLTLDAAAWRGLPRTDETRDFHCVEGWSVDAARWSGVRLADVLQLARPRPGGAFVTFHALGGKYVDSLSIAEATDPAVLLADTLDGRPLPAAHGGPVRLVVPAQLGYKNVKWVVKVEVADARVVGYWEGFGYPVEAPIGS
jgi:DMSO/TMAO reductase YedYZ molybdopterin-dependent catalytic subunit